MLTGLQLRMARSALRWSVQELAERSQVSASTIKRAEAVDGLPVSTRANLVALAAAFASAGIEFIGAPDDAPGLRVHTKPDAT